MARPRASSSAPRGPPASIAMTIRDVLFDRSRGFALESVDGADLRDVVMTDVRMRNVSSSPIFIRLGDRGRTPVTGKRARVRPSSGRTSVRVDETAVGAAESDRSGYGRYPPIRHVPSYVEEHAGAASAARARAVLDRQPGDADAAESRLPPSPDNPLDGERRRRAFARVGNSGIRRVTIEDADPSLPDPGLPDSSIIQSRT